MQVEADGAVLVQHSPFTWFPYGGCGVHPVSLGRCWKTHRIVRVHTNARWAGMNAWCPARSLPPTVWWRWVCHRASCSPFWLCVLLSPHHSVLQEGRRWGEEATPLLSALSNHSVAPPGAAAARCLRTDYAAFRRSRNYYKQLQGSLL